LCVRKTGHRTAPHFEKPFWVNGGDHTLGVHASFAALLIVDPDELATEATVTAAAAEL